MTSLTPVMYELVPTTSGRKARSRRSKPRSRIRSMMRTSWPARPAATYSSSSGSQTMMCFRPIVCGGTGARTSRMRIGATPSLDDPRADAPPDVVAVVQVHADDEGPQVGPQAGAVAADAGPDGAPGEQPLVQLPVAGLQADGVEAARPEDHLPTAVAREVLRHDPPLGPHLVVQGRPRDRRQDVDPRHRDAVAHHEVVGPLEHRLV